MPTLRRLLIPALVVAAAISAAACGPNGATAAPPTSTPAAAAPAASAPADLPAGAADSAKIQQCLAAAGITLPSGGFGPRPSGFAPPSGGFGPLPSGFAPPSGGFPGGATDPAVAAALKACGLTLPGAPGNP